TIILKLLCLIMIIGFAVNTFVVIHWHFDPDFYANFKLVEPNQRPSSILDFSYKSSWTTAEGANEFPFALSNIKFYSFYFMYFQLSAIFYLIYLMSREFIRVINSVRLVQSFQKRHVLSFRKIGKCLFVLFLVSSIRLIVADMGEYFAFSFNLILLFLMLI